LIAWKIEEHRSPAWAPERGISQI